MAEDPKKSSLIRPNFATPSFASKKPSYATPPSMRKENLEKLTRDSLEKEFKFPGLPQALDLGNQKALETLLQMILQQKNKRALQNTTQHQIIKTLLFIVIKLEQARKLQPNLSKKLIQFLQMTPEEMKSKKREFNELMRELSIELKKDPLFNLITKNMDKYANDEEFLKVLRLRAALHGVDGTGNIIGPINDEGVVNALGEPLQAVEGTGEVDNVLEEGVEQVMGHRIAARPTFKEHIPDEITENFQDPNDKPEEQKTNVAKTNVDSFLEILASFITDEPTQAQEEQPESLFKTPTLKMDPPWKIPGT